ncbi:MAG: Gfo/Idh/MocA family oxidoreductase [Verrucomicrobiota bacterium]
MTTHHKKTSTNHSRRSFLKTGALAAGSAFTAPMILPSEVLGNTSKVGANSRIGVAYIGTGNIMKGHLNAFTPHKQTQSIMVCDVKDEALKNAVKLLKNKHKIEVQTTKEHEEVLSSQDVDVVVIGTPDHWHASIAIAAMKAGKDVYLEKPATLTIDEGKFLVAAEKKYGRILQVGSQQRSDRHFRNAANIIRNGWIGNVEKVYCKLGNFPQPPANEVFEPVPSGIDYDRWLGPTPYYEYSAHRVLGDYSGGWRCYWDYGSRKFGDWGAHHFDITQWALNRDNTGPVEFIPQGYQGAEHHHYRYQDGITVFRDRNPEGADSMDDPKNGKKISHMIWFFGDEGKLGVSRGGKISVIPEKYKNHRFSPDEEIVYTSTNHRNNFIDCVLSRKEPVCPASVGHRTATICHLAAIAERLGKPVRWDPEKEEIIGSDEARKMQDRQRREGYELPVV